MGARWRRQGRDSFLRMNTRFGIRERRSSCAIVAAFCCSAISAAALAAPVVLDVTAPVPPVLAPEAAAVPAVPVAPAALPSTVAPTVEACASLPGYPNHLPRFHDGFYLRLTQGFGTGSVRGDGTKYSGGSVGFSAAFGGALTPHLVLYGEFLFHVVPNPKGDTQVDGATLAGNPVASLGLGPGIAYYFMPLNLYLSGSLLLQQTALVKSYSDGSDGRLTTGLGLSLMVGKEWWVSGDWGLGVAAQLFLASAREQSGTQWKTGALAMLFSDTWN
jgi:hypothetical protein